MGKGSSRKGSGGSYSARRSGQEGMADGGAGKAEISEGLRVPLVEIDPSVAEQTRVRDSVSLVRADKLEVHASGSRLGNVPANLGPAVEKLSLAGGEVEEVTLAPLRVVVLLW